VAAGAYLLLWLALFCTCFYSCRTLRYTLLGQQYRGSRAFGPVADHGSREVPIYVGLLLGLLVLLVLTTEDLYYPLTVALGGQYLASSGVAVGLSAPLLLGETLASPNR
jgi:hypothetical protein